MRIVTIGLGLLALAAFGIAALLASHSRAFLRDGIVAPGVVTRLNAGPLHVDVTVTAADGHRFVYAENASHAPLAVGQRVDVRYLPDAPAQTAQVTTAGVYGTAWGFVIVGLIFVLAAALSPLVVASFPGLLGYPLRR